jgi:hypothetical protein
VRLSIITAAILLAAPASAGTVLDRHTAKLATFSVLLRQTERRPDTSDATHAAITVLGCRATSFGFRCRGVLSPVSFSGIDGSSCAYVVYVTRRSAKIVNIDCT